MTARDLLIALDRAGARLSRTADDPPRLVIDAPRGTITPALRDALRDHRDEIVSHLARRLEIEANRRYLAQAGRWHQTPDGRRSWTAHGEPWIPPPLS